MRGEAKGGRAASTIGGRSAGQKNLRPGQTPDLNRPQPPPSSATRQLQAHGLWPGAPLPKGPRPGQAPNRPNCPPTAPGNFKLADFGLARVFGSPDARLTNQARAAPTHVGGGNQNSTNPVRRVPTPNTSHTHTHTHVPPPTPRSSLAGTAPPSFFLAPPRTAPALTYGPPAASSRVRTRAAASVLIPLAADRARAALRPRHTLPPAPPSNTRTKPQSCSCGGRGWRGPRTSTSWARSSRRWARPATTRGRARARCQTLSSSKSSRRRRCGSSSRRRGARGRGRAGGGQGPRAAGSSRALAQRLADAAPHPSPPTPPPPTPGRGGRTGPALTDGRPRPAQAADRRGGGTKELS